MTDATVRSVDRIALAFDFDETLAPSTYPRLLEHCGFDPGPFVEERVTPLVRDHQWETPLARTHALLGALREQDRHLTHDDLREVGRSFPLYDGVPELFERVRTRARAIVEDVEVEFYLITAGYAEIPEHTSIAGEFDAIYGGALHFDDAGRVVTPKRVLTDAQKPRYLLQIAKGLELGGANPVDAFRPVPKDEWRVPVEQMIFLGDGSSDLPAFEFMYERGGMALALRREEGGDGWQHLDESFGDRRVENIAPSTYAEGGELLRSVMLAVDSIASRIALRRLSGDAGPDRSGDAAG